MARGRGTLVSNIGIPNAEGKFLRITQTGSVNGLHWSVHEMQIKGKEL